jgi:hypothetical protein
MAITVVPYAITTRDKVKTLFGITDATNDSLIDQIVNGVTDFIESYCDRRFKKTTYTNETYDTKDGQSKIFLKNYPVASLSAVEYRAGTISSPTWITYDANGYLLYGQEGYVKFFGKFPEVAQGMRFTYSAGYDIDFANEGSASHTLPLDLTLVATELSAKVFSTRQSQGITQMSTEGQSVTFGLTGESLSSAQKDILNGHTKHTIII